MTWALSLVAIIAMSDRTLLTSHARCWIVGSLPYLLCHLTTCASASFSGNLASSKSHIAKLESRGSRGFREILDVNSLRTRVGFGFFVPQLADSKPQTPRRGIGDSRLEPGFWMTLPRTMNTGGFVTSRKWGFIEIKILKNWMKARVPRDDKPGFHLE